MSNKIIFLHILKCGGTSMLHMLYEQFGVEYFHPVPISTVQNIVRYPSLRGVSALAWQHQINTVTAQYYGCIAGHYDWRLAQRLPDWHVLVMLRHPVDQLRSLYQYMVRSGHELGDVAIWMRDVGFDGWICSEHVRPYLNAMTTVLSGHHVRDVVNAMANLFSSRVTFGLVERYSDSIQYLNQKFGWSMVEQHRHISENMIELPAATREFVEHLQADDMVLYEAAHKLFMERVQ